jgi:hypothetical protein
MDSLNRKIRQILDADANFSESLLVVQKVGFGRIWLIGGAVYKKLVADLQKKDYSAKDYDFIVEKIRKPIPEIRGWELSYGSLGNPRFRNKKGLLIDVVPLKGLISVRDWGYQPSIRSFLRQCPLSIQSVAYDVGTRRLCGSGVKDIKNRVVRIKNKLWQKECLKTYGDRFDLHCVAKQLNLKAVNE